MPDRSIMGHTPPKVWRPLFAKLQRGLVDGGLLAPEAVRSLMKEAKHGGFADGPAFLKPLKAAASGEVSCDQLHEEFRDAERQAQDPELGAAMVRAAESLRGDIEADDSPSSLDREFYERTFMERYRQIIGSVEAKLLQRDFHGDYQALTEWQQTSENELRPKIGALASQIELDPTGQTLSLSPRRSGRSVPTAQQMNSPIPDGGSNGFVEDEANDRA